MLLLALPPPPPPAPPPAPRVRLQPLTLQGVVVVEEGLKLTKAVAAAVRAVVVLLRGGEAEQEEEGASAPHITYVMCLIIQDSGDPVFSCAQ